MPTKFTAFTTELRIARILDRELNGRAVKYNHYELKNIAFDEKKFPMLFWSCFVVVFLVIRNSSNKRRIGTTALIRGRRLLTFCPNCSAYSGAALIQVNTVYSQKFVIAFGEF